MPNPKFYLTTPIYYVNARPHIGHAYTTIVADVIARRHRLLGDDTYFLTGTDEHGQKIERSASATKIQPQAFTDQVSAEFRNLWKRMGLTNDDFIRTTEPRHKLGAQKLFDKLYQNGFIHLDTYTSAYCVSDEAFVDVPFGTPCPECGRITELITEANFFFKLSAFQRPLLDLIESETFAITPEARRNEVLSFLRGNVGSTNLNAPRTEAEKWDGEAAEPTIAYTAKGTPYLVGALKDLSVSRSSFTWGISVPDSAAKLDPRQKHVIYVWLDALANYMTAIGYGSDDSKEIAKFEKFWPADLHLVGKEIIRFHCVYWPAFLLALNLELQQPNIGAIQDKSTFRLIPDPATKPLEFHQSWASKWLPKAVAAHGWLLFDNSKMSKSKGNIVRTETILDAFGGLKTDISKSEQDLFGADVLRYFLLREIPFGQDGTFSFEAMVTRYNADLANGYGNLVSRTLNMIDRYFAGTIPPAPALESFDETYTRESDGLTMAPGRAASCAVGAVDIWAREFDNLEFSRIIEGTWAALTVVDRVISDMAPWKLAAQTDERSQNRLSAVLYTAAESIRIITGLLYPVMPYATAQVWAQLGLGDIEAAAKSGELKNLQWGGLKPGTKLGPLSPIFPRADKGLIQIMTDVEFQNAPKALTEPNPSNGPAPDAAPRTTSLAEPNPAALVAGSAALTTEREATPATEAENTSPQITIDDFAKIDLRVAQILVAERIPKADKLLRLEVDLGYEKRQILSGIAEFYTPEELVGRRIVVITNLAPRKMRGLESHGMLLAASEGDHGKPALATCGDDIALGSRLK